MSFISTPKAGHAYAPGWFLVDDEDCTRVTMEVSASGVTADADGGKHVAMGTPYPSNDANAIGILYEDVDVTLGNMPGSVVTQGVVYVNRLPVTLASAAKTALAGLGFKFVDEAPVTTRPADGTETEEEDEGGGGDDNGGGVS